MLKLILPKGYEFNVYDYGTPISFNIYNEDDTVFDGSAYAGYVEITDESGQLVISEIQTAQINSSGVGSFAFTSTILPVVSVGKGFTQYYMCIRLEKPGVVQDTERRKIVLKTNSGTVRQP